MQNFSGLQFKAQHQKGMFFCLGKIEIILDRQGGSPFPFPPPLATRLITKVKPFIDECNWEGITYPSGKDDWTKFKKNNISLS